MSGAHNRRSQRGTARYNGQIQSLFTLMKGPLHPFSFTLIIIRFAHFGLWLGLWCSSYRTLSLYYVCSSTVSGTRVTTELLENKWGPEQRGKLKESTLSLLGKPSSVQGELFHSTTVTAIRAIYIMNSLFLYTQKGQLISLLAASQYFTSKLLKYTQLVRF